MRKILLLYVKPHVQEDPLAMLLGLTYLGACLEREGIPVELCDERIVDDAYVKAAIERNDVVGCSSLTPNVRRAIAWAKYAKERGKTTIMGGPHASVDPGLFLDSGFFDYVLKGEAEFTLSQLMKAIDGGREEEIAAVPGVAFNRDGDRVDNPAPPLIKKLDEIPFPARHLLPQDRYFQLNPERLAYIFTTRGCPYKCIFCQKELTGRGYRVRSTENIVEELAQVITNYHPGSVLFIDEIFSLRKKRIHELCEAIIRRGLKFEWVCNTRADCVDFPLLKTMYKAGCRRIYYGWESGSQRMLDVLKKDLTPTQIIEAAHMTRRAGIWAKVFLIVGSPGETREDIVETERVLKIASPDLIRVSVFNPLVGTPSWDLLQARINIDDLTENYVSSNRSAYTHEHFTQEELEEVKRDLVRSYERWYNSTNQKMARYMDRVRFYLENPRQGSNRLKRAVGLRPQAKLVKAEMARKD